MRGRWAFTSVEMIVVLGLVATIYLVLAPTFRPSRQAIAEQQFWHELRQNWRAAQVAAQIDRQRTIVEYYAETQQLVFNRDDDRSAVNIPATIEVKKFDMFIIDGSGYTAPRTICFRSRLRHCQYLMKIQLAWGGYRIEKVPD